MTVFCRNCKHWKRYSHEVIKRLPDYKDRGICTLVTDSPRKELRLVGAFIDVTQGCCYTPEVSTIETFSCNKHESGPPQRES